MIVGISTLQMVILAIITGTITPKNAINFLNPWLIEKAFVHTTKTKILTQSCRHPASKLEFAKKFVKLAIKKKKKPVIPDITIHFEFSSIMSNLLLIDIQFMVCFKNYQNITTNI